MLELLFHGNTRVFILFATIFIVLQTIGLKLNLTDKHEKIQDPQNYMDGMNNAYRTAANTAKNTTFMGIFLPCFLMMLFQALGIGVELGERYPLMTYDTKALIAMGSVGTLHFIGSSIQPPSMLPKFRKQYVIWVVYIYVIFIILGWIPAVKP